MNSMLEYKGYHASIKFDADDDIFVGEVFGITDSISFHGSSVDELKIKFEQSIDNYLDLCQKFGKKPDKEFRGTFNVRIPPELHQKAALTAAEQNITLNQFVMRAIEQFINYDSINNIIIYIPYKKEHMKWDSHVDPMCMNEYNNVPIELKEVKCTYAGN